MRHPRLLLRLPNPARHLGIDRLIVRRLPAQQTPQRHRSRPPSPSPRSCAPHSESPTRPAPAPPRYPLIAAPLRRKQSSAPCSSRSVITVFQRVVITANFIPSADSPPSTASTTPCIGFSDCQNPTCIPARLHRKHPRVPMRRLDLRHYPDPHSPPTAPLQPHAPASRLRHLHQNPRHRRHPAPSPAPDSPPEPETPHPRPAHPSSPCPPQTPAPQTASPNPHSHCPPAPARRLSFP